MVRRVANIVLLAYVAALGALLLARFDAWGDRLSATTARALAAPAPTDLWGVYCVYGPNDFGAGIGLAVVALLVAGPLLSLLAFRFYAGGGRLDPGAAYLGLGLQCMNWLLSAVGVQVLLIAAALEGGPWFQGLTVVAVANVAVGPLAIWRWRQLGLDAVGWRPALLALR
ncbi:MAG: hypothetical protein AB7U83_08575 [Vicinamibacterales bacterium]